MVCDHNSRFTGSNTSAALLASNGYAPESYNFNIDSKEADNEVEIPVMERSKKIIEEAEKPSAKIVAMRFEARDTEVV